jgi:phytanoyl-CoA hydroxylase
MSQTVLGTSPNRLEQFHEQGYVILQGVLPPAVVEAVRAEMRAAVDEHARQLLEAGKITDALVNEPFETRLARLYANCMDVAPMSIRGDALHRPGLFGLFFHPPLLDMVESILGPEIRLYPNYTARPKYPDHAKTEVLWHQDAGYTEQMKTDQGVDALRMVNVWSPLVPARVENGCMQFVPATHKLGVVPHVQKEYYLEIDPEHLKPHLPQAINIELDPGDVVLFSNLLFHVGLPNRTKTIRWSVDWRYQDATQPTLRKAAGHIVRSRANPASAVQTPEQWSHLEAGFV